MQRLLHYHMGLGSGLRLSFKQHSFNFTAESVMVMVSMVSGSLQSMIYEQQISMIRDFVPEHCISFCVACSSNVGVALLGLLSWTLPFLYKRFTSKQGW